MIATAGSKRPADSPAVSHDVADWFVVHTKPRGESLAREHLLRQGFEVYLPMFKVFKAPRRRGAGRAAAVPDGAPSAQTLTAHEPMFPRYLFLRPSRPTQSLSCVRSTQGVSRLVMFGSQPARIAQPLVDGIRAAEAAREHTGLTQISPYQPGTPVRLQDPALGGLQALVQAVSRDRVTLLLEILGRPQLVSVDFDRIAPL
uniref:transcription termination/antitermination protein NusG n=1 Tax=Castellaniella defragrans TaxID=75697 RepID=UPI003340AD87